MIFEHLFILGRPASGKSEFIDFIRKMPDTERASLLGIGKFQEIDDFPWLFRACTEDDEREARFEPRLVSTRTPDGYNISKPKFRSSLVDQFNEQIAAKYLSNPEFYKDGTLLIEFARGKEDGFRETLERFNREILKRGAIFFIKVSFEESFRRNSARYRRGLEETSLWHKVPDRDMVGFFRDNDWHEMTCGADEGWLDISGVRVPFVVMNNEPESTDPEVLLQRYSRSLGRLIQLVKSK